MVNFQEKVLLVWIFLEVYSLLFILFIFLKKTFFLGGFSFVYFGLLQMFSRIGFFFFFLKDFGIVCLIFILGKIGSFPMLDWVIFFIKENKFLVNWCFFSIKKFIPFYIIREFLKISVYFLFIIFFFNFFFRIIGALSSFSFLNLISWSSVGGNSFFLLLLVLGKKLFFWEFLLVLYRIILYIIFSNSEKFSFSMFVLVCLIFGFPPISMFVFKGVLILGLFGLFNIFFQLIFFLFFLFFGLRYFIFFYRESNSFFLKVYFLNNSFFLRVFIVLFLLLFIFI